MTLDASIRLWKDRNPLWSFLVDAVTIGIIVAADSGIMVPLAALLAYLLIGPSCWSANPAPSGRPVPQPPPIRSPPSAAHGRTGPTPRWRPQLPPGARWASCWPPEACC